MSSDAEDWLDYLRRSVWLARAPLRLVRPEPLPDGRWSLGDLSVSEADLRAARPEGPVGRVVAFNLVHDGWRVAAFTRFCPLVYFAAFGPADIFACLHTAVASLVEYGRWRWDVLVLTAHDTLDQVRMLLDSCGLGPRLHVAAVEPARTLLDWCMARYRLDADVVMATARPLLYLDVDIVCDRPLEPLLMHLAVSRGIHACAEGRLDEGGVQTSGHWFGWRLMAEDGVPFDGNAPGFSSGAFGMADAESAATAFALIGRSAYADAAQADGGRRLAGIDQPFANYVMHKLGGLDIHLMPRVLNLYRLDVGQARFPDPRAAKGLVHFLGAPTADKLAAMRDYLAALRAARG